MDAWLLLLAACLRAFLSLPACLPACLPDAACLLGPHWADLCPTWFHVGLLWEQVQAKLKYFSLCSAVCCDHLRLI
jgi:hypothetical protein